MAAKKPRLPAPPKSKLTLFKCVGGPYDGQDAMLPAQPNGDPLSLPIRVGEHVGRYNLNTGHWVPLEMKE